MLVPGNRLGDECDAALKIRDDQRAMPGRLVFSRPQLAFALPGPARPQRAVYQRDHVSGGLGCVLGRRPVLVCSFLDEWREERDVPRYRRLRDAKDIGPYVLDDILAQISAGDDQCLPQGQLTRTSLVFIPRFFEKPGNEVFQLAELPFVQS